MSSSTDDDIDTSPSIPLEDMLKLITFKLSTASMPHEIENVEPYLNSLSENESLSPDMKQKVKEVYGLLEKAKARIEAIEFQKNEDPEISDTLSERSNEDSDISFDSVDNTFGNPLNFDPEHLASVTRSFVSQVNNPKFVLFFYYIIQF